MQKVKTELPDTKGKKAVKGFFAAFGLAAALLTVAYLKSGWAFFTPGKNVALDDLSSLYSDSTGSNCLKLDKSEMTCELTGDEGFRVSSVFTYKDGCIKIDHPDEDCDIQVIDKDSVYWAAKDVFMVAGL